LAVAREAGHLDDVRLLFPVDRIEASAEQRREFVSREIARYGAPGSWEFRTEQSPLSGALKMPGFGQTVRALPSRSQPTRRNTIMAQAKLTPLQQAEADRKATDAARANKSTKSYSDEEKTIRKERVAKAKDAMTRSVGLKGVQVAPGRAAIKKYLQNLNDPKQPDDQQFDTLIEAPFKAPPKKRTDDRRF